jgi:hypothetical protein
MVRSGCRSVERWKKMSADRRVFARPMGLIPSKVELFKQVVSSRIGRFLLEADDIDAAREDLSRGLVRLLTAFGRLGLDPETAEIFRLVVSEGNRFPELGQAFYNDAIERTVIYMAKWLERRCCAGRIRLNDPHMAAGILRGMMARDPERSVLLRQARPLDAAQIAERARECAKLFLEGCMPR